MEVGVWHLIATVICSSIGTGGVIRLIIFLRKQKLVDQDFLDRRYQEQLKRELQAHQDELLRERNSYQVVENRLKEEQEESKGLRDGVRRAWAKNREFEEALVAKELTIVRLTAELDLLRGKHA